MWPEGGERRGGWVCGWGLTLGVGGSAGRRWWGRGPAACRWGGAAWAGGVTPASQRACSPATQVREATSWKSTGERSSPCIPDTSSVSCGGTLITAWKDRHSQCKTRTTQCKATNQVMLIYWWYAMTTNTEHSKLTDVRQWCHFGLHDASKNV